MNRTKTILKILLLSAALSAPPASAARPAAATEPGISARASAALIKKVEKRRKRLQEAELVQFLPSPGSEVEQGGSLSLFIRSKTLYSGANVILDARLDGAPALLSKPSSDLWLFDSGSFHEIREHELRVSVSVEDKDLSAQLRTAITQADRDIAALERQIAVETDPVRLADLIAQRDAKTAIRNDLIASLGALKTPVGEEAFRFRVVQKETGPDYPRITRIYPNFTGKHGSFTMDVHGENFSGSPEVRVAGHSLPGVLAAPTRVQFQKPEFAAEGIYDVEVRIPQASGEPKNAILRNGLFVASDVSYPIYNVAPVAVARGGWVNHGDTITLDGTSSYDLNNDTLEHTWILFSKPQGSLLPVSGELGTGATLGFTPDTPGVFVVVLRVRETDTPQHFTQESLAVVHVNAMENRPPVVTLSPSSLTLPAGGSATVNIGVQDPDFWQQHGISVAQQPTKGYVYFYGDYFTYHSSGIGGTDSVVIAVADNANPPEIAYVTLPVTITGTNQPPAITSDLFTFQMSEGFPLMIRWNVLANDPDGTISQIRYDYGDGTWGYGNPAAGTAGSSAHDYFSTGPFNGQVWVRDNLGWESTKTTTSPVDLTSRVTNKRPVNRVTASAVSGQAPLEVTFNAASSFDPDGTISAVWWNFGDGSTELRGGPELLTVTKTFMNPGTYGVRFRLRDNLNAESDHLVTIYVGGTPPSGGTAPTADFVPTPREVVLGNAMAFDGARSNDPNPDASTLTYSWKVQDSVTCNAEPGGVCSYTGQTVSHTYGSVGNFYPSLTVQNQNGAVSAARIWEVHVVNQGHAPRAYFTAWPTSGAVPLTVNLNAPAGLSFDYDGTIASHSWSFGDGSPLDPAQTVSHTYLTPGVYFVNHSVTDNDGNRHTLSQMITVNASLRAKTTPPADDEERSERRSLLTNACGQGQGEACYWLGKMHEEDGDAFAAQKLLERACSLGHQAACSLAPWTKW